jgi:hypothetical protein
VARDGHLGTLGTAQWRNAAAYTLLDFLFDPILMELYRKG